MFFDRDAVNREVVPDGVVPSGQRALGRCAGAQQSQDGLVIFSDVLDQIWIDRVGFLDGVGVLMLDIERLSQIDSRPQDVRLVGTGRSGESGYHLAEERFGSDAIAK